MPKKLPSYRHHKGSGQGYTSHRGKCHYFGPYNSPESQAKFSRFIAELTALKTAEPSTLTPDSNPYVAELVNAFLDHATRRYVKDGKPTTELAAFKLSLSLTLPHYQGIRAKDFGPVALETIRRELLAHGLARKTINQYIGRIVFCWKWATSQQFIPVTTWQALTSLEPLRRGQGKEMPKVRSISEAVINPIEPFVSPQIWAMVQFQLWTGCRPHEACQLRESDIDKSHSIWEYRPGSFKTQHRDGSERVIFLGPHAQKIVTKWQRSDPMELLWQTHEGRAAAMELAGANPKFHTRRRQGAAYTSSAYGRAVERGCEKSFGMPDELKRGQKFERPDIAAEIKARAKAWRLKHCWSPNQLRHAAATRIRAEYGIETARIILGHTTAFTTEIYAEHDREKARKAVRESG